MARTTTDKVQLTGYRLLIRRVEQAFIRSDVSLNNSPFSYQTVAFLVGPMIACLVLGFGFLQSVIAPRADQGSADIIITNASGPYVMFDGRLRPVDNLASARLIVGKPEVAKIVKEASLERHPRDLQMGIPGAPNNLTMRTDDTASWAVCDQHTEASTLSLTLDSDMTTTLFAGDKSLSGAVTYQPDNEAILAKQVGEPNRLWLIYMQRKAEIFPEDQAAKHALGISPSMEHAAVPVSQALMDTISPSPALTVPYIPDRGVVNPLIPSVVTGDVIVTRDSNGNRLYHVALTSGVERITEFLAQLLENTGSTIVTEVSPDKLSSLPKVSDIDISRYPEHAPKFTTPHVLCWKWTRGDTDLTARMEILTGESLPVKDSERANVVQLPKPSGTIVQATGSLMTPGKGWFVQITGDAPQSQAREQLMWIDDTGIRYFIGVDTGKSVSDKNPYEKTIASLGINSREPLLIPWSIAKLYLQGPTLSRKNALVEHPRVIDYNQRAVPDPEHPDDNRHPVAVS